MVKKGDRKVTKGDDHEIVDSQRLKKVFFSKYLTSWSNLVVHMLFGSLGSYVRMCRLVFFV